MYLIISYFVVVILGCLLDVVLKWHDNKEANEIAGRRMWEEWQKEPFSGLGG